MYAVIYRWRLRPNAEGQFVDGWERVTRAIHAACGSFGSRLHRAGEGTWVAYARWPDLATRQACSYDEPVGEQLMADAVAHRYEETTMEIVSDLLTEPEGTPRP